MGAPACRPQSHSYIETNLQAHRGVREEWHIGLRGHASWCRGCHSANTQSYRNKVSMRAGLPALPAAGLRAPCPPACSLRPIGGIDVLLQYVLV